MKTIIPLDSEVFQVYEALDTELYAVGGVVRDFLFNLFHGLPFDPKDVDLATALHPEEVLTRLTGPKARQFGIKTLPIGQAFGVVAALFPSGTQYEIATFREEWYDPLEGDGRRPDKVQYSTPEADAKRRDLTINSLFYDIKNERILDFVGTGVEDIRQKVIRCVGDPEDRFAEDRLRVLRLIRFFCRYNGGIAKEVLDEDHLAAVDYYADLPGISAERIRKEFLGGLAQAITPEHFVTTCHDLDVTGAMFPELNYVMVRQQIASRNPHIVLASMFCGEESKRVWKTLNKMSYTHEEIQRTQFLCSLWKAWNNGNYRWDQTVKLVTARKRFDDLELSDALRAVVFSRLCEEASEFGRLHGIDPNLIGKLLQFQPKTCAANFPAIPEGPELGLAIQEGINHEFKACLGAA